jgi:hypothetical protein
MRGWIAVHEGMDRGSWGDGSRFMRGWIADPGGMDRDQWGDGSRSTPSLIALIPHLRAASPASTPFQVGEATRDRRARWQGPGTRTYVDPVTGRVRQRHLHATVLRRAGREAVLAVGLSKRAGRIGRSGRKLRRRLCVANMPEIDEARARSGPDRLLRGDGDRAKLELVGLGRSVRSRASLPNGCWPYALRPQEPVCALAQSPRERVVSHLAAGQRSSSVPLAMCAPHATGTLTGRPRSATLT